MSYNRSDYRDKLRIERGAEAVRSGLGLDQVSVLNPHDLLERLGVELLELRDLIPDDELALRRGRAASTSTAARHITPRRTSR